MLIYFENSQLFVILLITLITIIPIVFFVIKLVKLIKANDVKTIFVHWVWLSGLIALLCGIMVELIIIIELFDKISDVGIISASIVKDYFARLIYLQPIIEISAFSTLIFWSILKILKAIKLKKS